MKQSISESSIYIRGAARYHDLIYLVAQDKGLEKRKVPHSRFIAFDQEEFAHMGDRNWTGVDLGVVKKPAEKMIAVGEEGQVFTYVAGEAKDEAILPAPVALRGLGIIDGTAFACGMKREVFRRDQEANWVNISAPPPNAGENAGFEAICGFGTEELYAAGWNGEIWGWNGKTWEFHPSPTNVILTSACCAGDDVYICGQDGTLIRGRFAQWELVGPQLLTDDLWDVCWFQESLYVATMTALFGLVNGELTPIDFGEDFPATCGQLTEAEGVLWSVGSSDIFFFDGVQWKRLD